MASVEDLYRNIAGRGPDAEGLAYWNQQLASGTSFSQVEQAFRSSVETVKAREAAAGSTVLGKDI
ncbi:MAG TPA: DUF4214 domain-containing protein, partial [Clostridia bacterium]|nr:DUF4214 domain-containing protein [Clostridia bacterium]